MTSPGITVDQARAHVAALNLLLASHGIDADTERRAVWLKLRLCEIIPGTERPLDVNDALVFLIEGRQPAGAA